MHPKKIDKKIYSLYIELKERLGGTAIREVLQAVAGLKVSRISMSLNHLPWIYSLFEKYNITFLLSKKSFRPVIEKDNKKWISKLEVCDDNLNDPHVSKSIYIGNSIQLVEDAMHFEEKNDDDEFGRLLGIPSCCRKFYKENLAKASLTNNDFTYLSLGEDENIQVNNKWCNVLGQYFGYALISFSPCNFNCEHAANLAKNSYYFLYHIDKELAFRMIEFCSYSGLYTLESGLGLFKYLNIDNLSVKYIKNSILNFNLSLTILDHLYKGDILFKKDSNNFYILNHMKSSVYNDKGSILIFGDT